jgi:hypothetical protein
MYRSYADVYGSSKTSSHRQQMLGFAPTSSMVGSGEKLGTDPRIDQSTCYGLCQEPFSRKQWPYSPLSMTREWLPRTGGCPQETYAGRTWTGVGSIRVMLIGFSLAGCISIRITATLRYE